MKKIIFLITFMLMGTSSNFLHGQTTDGKKMLVAYYSWSGNTEVIAKYISEITGADIFVIEPSQEYPADYNECIDQAKKEINAGYRPSLKSKVPNINSYDIIFLGTPNWWSTIAPPVASFLDDHDLSGKSILPFVTHGGGREARCFRDMEKIASDSEFLKGFVVSGARVSSSKPDVEKWLKETGVI